MNIADALADHARDRPDHPAIEDGDSVVTHADLQRRVTAAAHRLQASGVKSGDVVGVRLADGADYFVLCFAIARVGGVIVSINPQHAPGDQQLGISNLDVKCVVSGQIDPPLGSCEIPPVRQICEATPADLGPFLGPNLEDDHPVVCRQSSGTTGVPKSALWSHRQFLVMKARVSGEMAWTSEDRLLQVVQLSFSYSRDQCLSLLQRGGTVVINRTKTARGMAEAIRDRAITYLSATPAHLRSILNESRTRDAEQKGPLFPSLRMIFCTSSALTSEERKDIMARMTPNFCESFGTNEGGSLTLASPADLTAHPDSVGRLPEGLEAQVVDSSGRALPAGETGAIGFRGEGLPSEYHRDPEATARHFLDGWYYPGDLAAIDSEGYIYFRGRADDAITNQGATFYPFEVEQVLETHPDVDEAAVFGWPSSKAGEVAVACLVGGRELHIGEVKAFCGGRLANHKVPVFVANAKYLPKTASGKVIKQELQDMMRPLLEKSIS